MIDSQLSRAVQNKMAQQGMTAVVEVDRVLGFDEKYLGKFLRGDQVSLHEGARARLVTWLGWTREAFDLVYGYHQKEARRRRRKAYVKRQEESGLADIEGMAFPIPTLIGNISREPLSMEGARECSLKGCPVYEECRRALLRGDFILCERPLEREMVPDSVLRQAV